MCGGVKLCEVCVECIPLDTAFVLSTGNPFRGLSLVDVGCYMSFYAQLVPLAALLHVHP